MILVKRESVFSNSIVLLLVVDNLGQLFDIIPSLKLYNAFLMPRHEYCRWKEQIPLQVLTWKRHKCHKGPWKGDFQRDVVY